MGILLGALLILLLLVGGCSLFFLMVIQPIWSVVHALISKELSRGTKVILVILALMFGPLMTFFYAIVGSRSRLLKGTTLISFVAFLISGGSLLGLAVAVPAVQQKLSWPGAAPAAGVPSVASSTPPGTTNSAGAAEASVKAVEPEKIGSFLAVHLANAGPLRWLPTLAEFDGHGPKLKTAQPLHPPGHDPISHIAIDSTGPVYYGIATHEVGRIVRETGKFEELGSTPGISKPSWPSAIAFDSKRRLLLVSARSTGYSYDPKSGEWQELSWLKDDGIVGLAYDAQAELLYALQREGVNQAATSLLQFNSQGALVAKTSLSSPIPVAAYPAPMTQLVTTDGTLVAITYPDPRRAPARADTGCQLFLINPSSGECRPVGSSSTGSR